ncbi:MAG: ATP-binding protein, partial [Cyanobacteria bacterium J06623_7]
ETCLQCHSRPEIAPPKMIDLYGDKNGFNWQLNQLTSAQTIYVPASSINSDVRRGMIRFLPISTGIFALLIVLVNRFLQYTVIKPLDQLTRTAQQLSYSKFDPKQHRWDKNLTGLAKRNDEPGKLARVFLLMAEKVFHRERDLHQVAIDSTKDLKLEIKERTAIERKLARQVKRALLQEKITQEIRQSLDTSQILQTAVNNVGRAFKVSRCQIFSYCDVQPRSAKVIAEYILPQYPQTLNLDISLNEAICLNTAMSQEKAVYWSHVYKTPLLKPCVHIYKQLKINSLMTVRTSYQGKVNGAISIQQCDRDRRWHPEEIELMESVASQVGIALAQAQLLQQEKQRNLEIEAAKQEAEIANRSKTEFLANISHELRTPLNAIIGFSQLMNRDPAMNPQQQETINIINRSGEHLLEMINEVLEMSKIEAGKTELHLADVDLNLMLNTLSSMLGMRAKSKNLDLIVDRATDVPNYIRTDESKLRQVLINLIGNGIKFTQKGKIVLRIMCLKTSQGENRLKFEVEDTGGGIAPEEIDCIFQAFSQSETGRQSKQGTGLGLPISKRFVELMGGNIEVHSQVGKGSIFSFSIIAPPINKSTTQLAAARVVTSLAPHQPTYRILAVDDVWQSRLLIVRLLGQVGFEVREAENGQIAVELAAEWQPDLILMDMRMPVMDGYQATRQIRGMGNQCKIIALTASAFVSKQKETIDAGCDDYLRKPFSEDELFGKIQDNLGIEYIYQSESEPEKAIAIDKDETESPSPQLTPHSLRVMPDGWLAELKQAATELDESKLAAMIQQIPPEHGHIAKQLTNLLDNFQFKQIFQLV